MADHDPNPDDIPSLVKHVAMRIYAKPFSTSHPPPAWVPPAVGKEQERFAIAFIMAINALSRQGYVAEGSSPRPGSKISLTGRGLLKERDHARDNPGSTARFDALYRATFAPPELRDPSPPRGGGAMPLQRPDDQPPPPSPVPSMQRRVIMRKEKRDAEARSTLGKLKSGIRRAKRAVAKAISSVTRRRPPKGRV